MNSVAAAALRGKRTTRLTIQLGQTYDPGPKLIDPKLTKNNAATSTNILALLQSDSDFDSNIRIVALSLSFPAIIRTPQSDSWNSRYDRFRADC